MAGPSVLLLWAGPAGSSRRLGKVAWAGRDGLASAAPSGSPSLPFHCGMSPPCAGDNASPGAWLCSRSIPRHCRRAAPARHSFAGLGRPPGPVSASWRALRPMAGPSVLLLRAGPTRTLSKARQGSLGWSFWVAERLAHWQPQSALPLRAVGSRCCRGGFERSLGETDRLVSSTPPALPQSAHGAGL